MVKLPKGTEPETLLQKFNKEKEIAVNYQKRRHKFWQEIYELYRNVVRLNRLTQRQAITMPLMKETIKSLLAKIGNAPYVDFKSKSGNLDKEIIMNALAQKKLDDCDFNLLDKVDKKQELLYGRSHMGLTLNDGKVGVEVIDIYDLLVDPNTRPNDIETARYIIRTNIYRSLNEIKADDRYDKKCREELSETKITEADKKQVQARNNRLRSIGVGNVDEILGYEKVVAVDEWYTMVWDKAKKEYVRYYVVIADNKKILRAEPLEDVYGVEFYPFEGWASDLETSDYWSDGVGDLILTPNKTINIWISQHMENRTLRTFGMNYYNSTVGEGYKPQTFTPTPGAYIPVPGNPREVFQRIEIPELSGSLQDIQFVVNFAEKASATGAITKGAVEDVKRTLGEIEIAVANANEITNATEDYYNTSRKRLLEKWYQMIVANPQSDKLYKENRDGELKELETSDNGEASYVDEKGYEIRVDNIASLTNDKTREIQNLFGLKQQFLPNNKALNKILTKKYASFVKITPQELSEIQEEEEQNAERGLQQQVEQVQQAQQQLQAGNNQLGIQ